MILKGPNHNYVSASVVDYIESSYQFAPIVDLTVTVDTECPAGTSAEYLGPWPGTKFACLR